MGGAVSSDESGVRVDPFTMGLRDGILWVDWIRGTSVSDADARAFIGRAVALSAGVRLPMLVELNGIVTVTRNAFLQSAKKLDIAAMALVGPSAVDKVIAAHFIEVHHPPYPTRYFPSHAEALVWLSSCSNAT
jgi:hypothetical protein